MAVDKKEFDQFRKNFRSMIKSKEQFDLNFLQTQGHNALNGIKKDTPVAKGLLRNKWICSKAIKTNKGIIGGITGLFTGAKYSITISNNQDYASHVEYGHRIMGGIGRKKVVGFKQGVFMAKRNVDRTINNMPKNYNIAFVKFVNNRGL
jgi:hypothetical protein